jgi:hypothetical protein
MKMTTMTMNKRIAALVIAVCVAACTVSLAAGDKKPDPRQPYALIFGTVYGPDQQPARGIKVKIRRSGEKKAIELFSDNHGEFAHRFPAGKADYVIWADLKDKQAAEKTQVKVHVENDERQDLTLHVSKLK